MRYWNSFFQVKHTDRNLGEQIKLQGEHMKNKLIDFTTELVSAGFEIAEMEVEGPDLVRIKISNHAGLELIVNSHDAQIIKGNCNDSVLQRLMKLIKKNYTIKDKVHSEEDIFNKLQSAL